MPFASLSSLDIPKLVVSSSSPSYDETTGQFRADDILTNECDARNDQEKTSNFFLAQHQANDGYVILDLGCSICIAGIILKNTNAIFNQ